MENFQTSSYICVHARAYARTHTRKAFHDQPISTACCLPWISVCPDRPEGWMLMWLYFYILSWLPEILHLPERCNLPFWQVCLPKHLLLPPFGVCMYKRVQKGLRSTRVCCCHRGKGILYAGTSTLSLRQAAWQNPSTQYLRPWGTGQPTLGSAWCQ